LRLIENVENFEAKDIHIVFLQDKIDRNTIGEVFLKFIFKE